MLMLSVEGLLNGLTAVGLFISGWVLGIFFIYQSRKTKAKLLLFLGIAFIFTVLGYWGVCFDFLSILSTDTIPYPTYPTPPFFVNIRLSLVFMWIGVTYLMTLFIGTELLIPKKKYYLLIVALFLTIVYELFIFLDPEGSIVNTFPTIPGEDLWLASLVLGTPVYFIVMILSLTALIFNVSGFIIKTKKSYGVLRKKFFLLSTGYFLSHSMLLLEGLLSTISILIFTRAISVIGFWILYLGLREEPEKPQESNKKEIKVEGGLIRLTKRPDYISEEEVTFHKEKKICLVCKGNVGRYMFMCPDCDALYCQNCAGVLENLENACWVCNGPIDPNKPVKSFKKEEEVEYKVSKDLSKKRDKSKN